MSDDRPKRWLQLSYEGVGYGLDFSDEIYKVGINLQVIGGLSTANRRMGKVMLTPSQARQLAEDLLRNAANAEGVQVSYDDQETT